MLGKNKGLFYVFCHLVRAGGEDRMGEERVEVYLFTLLRCIVQSLSFGEFCVLVFCFLPSSCLLGWKDELIYE